MASDSYLKSGKDVLIVERNVELRAWDTRRFAYIFDFEFRVMTIVSNYSDSKKESTHQVPFSSVDPDVLEKMHGKLVSMGGEPPPLERAPDHAKVLMAPPLNKKHGLP